MTFTNWLATLSSLAPENVIIEYKLCYPRMALKAHSLTWLLHLFILPHTQWGTAQQTLNDREKLSFILSRLHRWFANMLSTLLILLASYLLVYSLSSDIERQARNKRRPTNEIKMVSSLTTNLDEADKGYKKILEELDTYAWLRKDLGRYSEN